MSWFLAETPLKIRASSVNKFSTKPLQYDRSNERYVGLLNRTVIYEIGQMRIHNVYIWLFLRSTFKTELIRVENYIYIYIYI